MRPHIAPLLIALAVAGGVAPAREVRTTDYHFSYVVPPAAARIPALNAWLTADAERRQARIAAEAASGRRTARAGGFPFNPYDSTATWKVVTDTPRLLSLSADIYAFTGGAHGNPSTAALVWDKTARKRLAPVALFTSPAMIEAATRTHFCPRLKAERDRRLQGAVDTGGPFAQCPAFKDLVLLLGSTTGRRIDRIGLVADPYVAGSYAEGRYEVTLPVTPALLAAVRPAYRDAFAVMSPAR